MKHNVSLCLPLLALWSEICSSSRLTFCPSAAAAAARDDASCRISCNETKAPELQEKGCESKLLSPFHQKKQKAAKIGGKERRKENRHGLKRAGRKLVFFLFQGSISDACFSASVLFSRLSVCHQHHRCCFAKSLQSADQ